MEVFEDLKEVPIKWLSEVNINSAELVGEKAAFLGEAYSKISSTKKIIIPEAFIITKKAISEFFIKNNVLNSIVNIFSQVNWEDKENLEISSRQVKGLIMKLDFSKELEEEIFDSYATISSTNEITESVKKILAGEENSSFVAVRSSYMGDFGESYFNVKGKTNLIYSIKRCIASFYNVENLIEAKLKNISIESIRPAVIIQKMVQSNRSGNLVSGKNMFIKAIWGLGGGMKLKEILPDEYILRRDFKILEKRINEKNFAVSRSSDGSLKLIKLKESYSFSQVLEESEMRELCDFALKIDDVFKEKMQFDFAFSDEGVHVVKIEKISEKFSLIEENSLSVKNVEDLNLEENMEKENVGNLKEAVFNGEGIEEQKGNFESENKNVSKKEQGDDLRPVKITKTKIEVLVKNNSEKEKVNLTGLKRGIIFVEDIIKKGKHHPNFYTENFNTKEYGDLIYNGLFDLSEDMEEVWVRLSDFSANEFSSLDGAIIKKEENPLMGLRGIRFLISNSELLKREIKSILDLSNIKKVGLLIPKISSVYELKKVKSIVEEFGGKIKIGIILETPASIQLIKDFVEEGVDSVVFFGDSMSSYLLCVDPENESINNLYDDTSPALMYQIEYVIRVCKRRGVLTKFFGGALQKKEMIDYLVKKEIDSVILEPERVRNVSNLLSGAEEEFIVGTDKEMRTYELNKEKERQKKEMHTFEKIKDVCIKKEIEEISEKKEIEELSEKKESLKEDESLEEGVKMDEEREKEIRNDLPVDEAIEKIRKEKEEFKKNGFVEEARDEELFSTFDESEELVEEEILDTTVEELKKDDSESFDNEMENLEDADFYVEGDEAARILREEKLKAEKELKS